MNTRRISHKRTKIINNKKRKPCLSYLIIYYNDRKHLDNTSVTQYSHLMKNPRVKWANKKYNLVYTTYSFNTNETRIRWNENLNLKYEQSSAVRSTEPKLSPCDAHQNVATTSNFDMNPTFYRVIFFSTKIKRNKVNERCTTPSTI